MRMKSFRSAAVLLLFATLAAASGCAEWTPGWETEIGRALPGDVSYVRPFIEKKEQEADTRGRVEEVIRLYGAMLKMYPQDFQSLCKLGEYNCLMGASYSKTKSQKEKYFEAAAQYCERAMYTNRAFQDLADKGASTDEACWVLSERHMEDMFFWTLTLSSLHQDSGGGFGKRTRAGWTKRYKALADQMLEVGPEWQDGAVYTTLGIYYASIPDRKGESLETASDFFDKAVKAGPKSLLHRWARARYFDLRKGDGEAFKKDLEWVAAQDPDRAGFPGYAWNVHFQKDAKALIEKADELFGKKSGKAAKPSEPEAPPPAKPESPARNEKPAKAQPPVAPAKPATATPPTAPVAPGRPAATIAPPPAPVPPGRPGTVAPAPAPVAPGKPPAFPPTPTPPPPPPSTPAIAPVPAQPSSTVPAQPQPQPGDEEDEEEEEDGGDEGGDDQ